jgi:hypothetical protein
VASCFRRDSGGCDADAAARQRHDDAEGAWEIQASSDPVAVLAERHGVSETTVRRRRRRTDTGDRSHVRHNLGQATSPVEEAITAEPRTLAGPSLDDIAEVMNRCVDPGLSRGPVWRAPRRPVRARTRRSPSNARPSAMSTSTWDIRRSSRARASASSSPPGG